MEAVRSNGYQLEKTSGNSGGQGSLVCYHPWGRRVGHKFMSEPQQQRKAILSGAKTEIETGIPNLALSSNTTLFP